MEHQDGLLAEAEKHLRGGRVPLILHSASLLQEELLRLCKKFGGRSPIRPLPLIGGFATTVTPRSLRKLLACLPSGTEVALDREVHFPRVMQADSPTPPPVETAAERLPGLRKVWAAGYTGQGQTIAVIDSGVYAHADFGDRLAGWVDLAESCPQMIDPFGHGTHVSGILAGSGARCNHFIQGVAPQARLVILRILCVADAIAALRWCIENRQLYGITVVNMSLGDAPCNSWRNDPWALATQKVVQQGLVVVVAAGNEWPQSQTVCTPGTLPDVITVGAADDQGTLSPADDLVAGFSSRGQISDKEPYKPDVFAPGVRIFSTLSPGSELDSSASARYGNEYVAASGSSQATPMVAGLAALLKQANPALTPLDMGEILRRSTYPIGLDGRGVPAGMVQADRALELALGWTPGSARSRTRED